MPCKKYREHCLDSCLCNFVQCPFKLRYIYSINLDNAISLSIQTTIIFIIDNAISENLSILTQSFLDHVTSFSFTFCVLPAF